MKFGFATNFSNTEGKIDYQLLCNIKTAGFDFWEPPVCQIALLTKDQIDELEKFLNSMNLAAFGGCSLFPASLNIFTDKPERFKTYLHNVFLRLVRLGSRQVGFGSPNSRILPEGTSYESGFHRTIDFLHTLVLPILEEYGIKLLIEPLSIRSCNFINTLDEGYRLMQALGTQNIGLMADTIHMIESGDGPDKLLSKLSNINHIHISERNRILPENEYSPACADLISVITRSNYDETISFETKNGNIKAALDLLKKQYVS